jgi:chromosome segregation ATPase
MIRKNKIHLIVPRKLVESESIINDLKEKVDAAVKHALEELQNVQRTLITKNAELEELLKNRDDEILKLKELLKEIITRDEKIMELEDRLSKISNEAAPNLSDMQSIMTTFNNARDSDAVIFKECVEKLSEKFDKMADSMANAGSKIEACIKCFSTKNKEQMDTHTQYLIGINQNCGCNC